MVTSFNGPRIFSVVQVHVIIFLNKYASLISAGHFCSIQTLSDFVIVSYILHIDNSGIPSNAQKYFDDVFQSLYVRFCCTESVNLSFFSKHSMASL